MSNPEFKRNLWLSFSLHRLIAMPALLALTFLTAALMANDAGDVPNSLYATSSTLFIFIVWLWGARNAHACIVDELRDKTWDQQRMSALDPWTMTWGKLFGATAFNWYGGLICLAVMTLSGIVAGKHDVMHLLLTLTAVGIMIHAALIALNLHNNQIETRVAQRNGTNWMAILLALFLIQASFAFIPIFMGRNDHVVSWWNMDFDRALFLLDSALLFAACAILAAWRVTCNALQVRTLPWAWPLFACILTLYFAGFLHDGRLSQHLLIGLVIASMLTYATLFSEPSTLIRWRKLRLLQARADWRGWLEHLPLWTTTLALTFLFALLLVLTTGSDDTGLGSTDFLKPQYALTLALMLLRDACILLFFAFSPINRRVVAVTLLYLMVLDLLLPFLAGAAHLDAVRFFLMPIDASHDAWSSVLVMTVHTAIAIGLLNWRLRNSEQL
ncbi:MAG: hypothetical protein IPM27_00720 [Nitrosomonadales bacterium]|nr:hypothetical protein [Nitrosomonadales bacterium]